MIGLSDCDAMMISFLLGVVLGAWLMKSAMQVAIFVAEKKMRDARCEN